MTLSDGFAAGCEATAVPRHPARLFRAGYALGSGSAPFKSKHSSLCAQFNLGRSPHQGPSPKCNRPLTAWRSHRLTAGGKAESKPSCNLCAVD